MNGTLTISVEKDRMHAIALLENDLQHVLTKEYILDELHKQGIKAGIRHDIIDEILLHGMYGKKYIIATGKKTVPGSKGYYEYFFNTEDRGHKPQIREDGTVDYSIQRELVKKGDLLAQYHPAKPGSFGYTVYADVIAPVPIRNQPPLHLLGVEKKDNFYYARTNGEVSLHDNNLEVNERLTIIGDVGATTGTITYTGDVYITGDVLTDVTIIADGNVKIDGVVEAAHIEAGKDIVIRHGIHGKNRAYLKAGGSVYSFFITEAHIDAGENIGLPEKTGEFHLIDHEVVRFEVDKFYYHTDEMVTSEKKSQNKYTILLVDDEPLILKTFYSYLCSDYDVLAVTSAGDAFALLDSTIPDLILLDYMMPNMDGAQMLELLRKSSRKEQRSIPVIFVTAITDKKVVHKCLSLYPQGYLTKPLSKDELLRTVSHLFTRTSNKEG